MLYFTGTLKKGFMEQWQYTIIILGLIVASVKAICRLEQTSEGDRAFSLFCSLGFGLTLFMISKEYLELYVDLSKI